MNKETKLGAGDFRSTVPRFAPEAMEKNQTLIDLLQARRRQKKRNARAGRSCVAPRAAPHHRPDPRHDEAPSARGKYPRRGRSSDARRSRRDRARRLEHRDCRRTLCAGATRHGRARRAAGRKQRGSSGGSVFTRITAAKKCAVIVRRQFLSQFLAKIRIRAMLPTRRIGAAWAGPARPEGELESGSYGVICGSTGLLFVRRTLARHGRACPGHPRRAAARTSPASARPAGRRTVARLFALACVDALGLRGWPGQARP